MIFVNGLIEMLGLIGDEDKWDFIYFVDNYLFFLKKITKLLKIQKKSYIIYSI